MNAIQGQNWTVHNGDCREAFAALPAGSVHCVMTSPPYWGGIRDYGIPVSKWADGWEGCYGNEPMDQQYVAHTIEIFDALGHALREDGVIWWNIGDTYATSGGSGAPGGSSQRAGRTYQQSNGMGVKGGDIRTGNKCLVPFRVALALQEAGWIVRQDVIWRKPSPMPESIDGWRWERCRVKVRDSVPPTQDRAVQAMAEGRRTKTRDCIGGAWIGGTEWADCPGCPKCADHGGYVLRRGSWRPTTAHEFVFQVVKSSEYFCDASAAIEPQSEGTHARFGKNPTPSTRRKVETPGVGTKNNRSFDSAMVNMMLGGRNPRSVWSISSEAYKGKHFAAFPTMLAWKCIQASTSAGGCCAACGAQYAPVVEKGRIPTRPGEASKFNEWKQDQATAADGQRSTASPNRDPQRHIAVKRTTGYRPTCDCGAGDPVPCTVADPFAGSGTVLQVSVNTGRRFVGSEIAEHYLPLIQERAATPWVPKTDKKPKAKRRKHHRRQLMLIE